KSAATKQTIGPENQRERAMFHTSTKKSGRTAKRTRVSAYRSKPANLPKRLLLEASSRPCRLSTAPYNLCGHTPVFMPGRRLVPCYNRDRPKRSWEVRDDALARPATRTHLSGPDAPRVSPGGRELLPGALAGRPASFTGRGRNHAQWFGALHPFVVA